MKDELESGIQTLNENIQMTDFHKYVIEESKNMDKNSYTLGLISTFTGYAIGIIFLLGCVQVAFLKRQLRIKKII